MCRGLFVEAPAHAGDSGMRYDPLIGPVVLTRLARGLHRRRLHVAEQRFFDAYGRGGQLADRKLVIPIGYFARPQVAATLLAWLVDGDRLDIEVLVEIWLRAGEERDVAAFYENLAQFLAILHKGRAYAVTWRGPDGQLLSYGSSVFD